MIQKPGFSTTQHDDFEFDDENRVSSETRNREKPDFCDEVRDKVVAG
jgi:hypothetical protein